MLPAATTDSPDNVTRAGRLMVWLGGGSWRDIADHDERSTYQLAGAIVALNALAAWLVGAFAVTTGVVRPLLPERVTNFQANPVKTARTLLEEVEEFTFSLTRRRKVTVESNEPETHEQARAAEPAALRQSAVASRILDSAGEHRDVLTQGAEERRALPLGEQRPELAAGDAAGELASAARRELPPGRD